MTLPPRGSAFRWRHAGQPSTPRLKRRIVPFRSLDSQRSRSRKTADIWTIRETARSRGTIDLMRARDVLTALKRGIEKGQRGLETLAAAVEIEIAIAAAEREADKLDPAQSCDALFRLHIRRWAMDEDDLAELVPLRDGRLRILKFDYDVSEFIGVRTTGEFPRFLIRRRSYMVAFARSNGERRGPLVIDGITARILELSDGTRTAAEIVRQLNHEGDRTVISIGSQIYSSADWSSCTTRTSIAVW